MKNQEVFTVTVDGVDHHGISAVGIGHLRKDLVLVTPPRANTQESARELGTDWRQVCITRETEPA